MVLTGLKRVIWAVICLISASPTRTKLHRGRSYMSSTTAYVWIQAQCSARARPSVFVQCLENVLRMEKFYFGFREILLGVKRPFVIRKIILFNLE